MSDERALREALETAQGQLAALKRELNAELEDARGQVKKEVEQLRGDLMHERERAAGLARDARRVEELERDLARERTTNEHLRAEVIALRRDASRERAAGVPTQGEDLVTPLRAELERHTAANAQLREELNTLQRQLDESSLVRDLSRLRAELSGLRSQRAFEQTARPAPHAGGVSGAVVLLVAAAVLWFVAGGLSQFTFAATHQARAEVSLVLLVAAAFAHFSGKNPPTK